MIHVKEKPVTKKTITNSSPLKTVADYDVLTRLKHPPTYANGKNHIYSNGKSLYEAFPRGRVFLSDDDTVGIPVHELPTKPWWPDSLPDHTQLPDEDGEFVKNLHEHPQSLLITTSIRPVLDRLHPDEQYIIGQDSGIYWRINTQPLDGVKAPDWFYVPDVPPVRRGSYALWQELVTPTLVIEFVSGDGRAERDQTVGRGKFWVYENAIQPLYYAIYEEEPASVELYHLVNGQYQSIPANSRDHYLVPPMDIELGIWHGKYGNQTAGWLRVWDSQGNLLLSGEERAEQESQRANQEAQRANQEAQRANQEAQRANQEAQRANQEAQRTNRLIEQLRALGIEPDVL
ncbi:MAG: Uma2 family endonuclease [Chloroflexota bacterium]